MDDSRQMGVRVDHCKRQALLPAGRLGHGSPGRDDANLFTNVSKGGPPDHENCWSTISFPWFHQMRRDRYDRSGAQVTPSGMPDADTSLRRSGTST